MILKTQVPLGSPNRYREQMQILMRRLECISRDLKVLWIASKVFLMYLWGNRRWVPLNTGLTVVPLSSPSGDIHVQVSWSSLIQLLFSLSACSINSCPCLQYSVYHRCPSYYSSGYGFIWYCHWLGVFKVLPASRKRSQRRPEWRLLLRKFLSGSCTVSKLSFAMLDRYYVSSTNILVHGTM